jgi:lysophospholipase L1-like esterase
MKKSFKKLFVIGDSISCYYGKYLEQYVKDVFEYDRKGGSHTLTDLDDCTNGINGGDSSMVLTYLSKVVTEKWFAPDCLLINCGLHDTKCGDGGGLQIPIEQYAENLQKICVLLKANNIKMIWVRTTPLNKLHSPPGSLRTEKDIEHYNKIADAVMNENSVPIIDLNTFTSNLEDDIYLNGTDKVHFNDNASALQAAFIAGAMRNKGFMV